MTKKYTEEKGMNYDLFGYNYQAEYDNLRRESKKEDSDGYPIAKGQPKKLSRIDYGFTLLEGELPKFELIWEKRSNYKKGNTKDYLTIEGTMKEIIDHILEYPIFLNDTEGKTFLRKLFVEYEPKLPVIKKRYIVTKQFKAKDNPEDYQQFLEMTKEWTEAMKYTFGTYFINYHFNQYFLRNKWSRVDNIRLPFLIGDEGGCKTPIADMIELPDHPHQDTFNGNLTRTIGERPNTYASFRDSLSIPSRGITLDESGDILLDKKGQSNRLSKEFENLLLQFGKQELPSRKSRTGNGTIRQSWTGYPMIIFNDDVKFIRALNKRVDKIQFNEPYDIQANHGWLEADWLINNLQSLFYAVAYWIFKYPEKVYDIESLKEYVWTNLGAPWLATAKNQTEEDKDIQITSYIKECRGYLKYKHVDITDEDSIRQYFIEEGLIRIDKNDEDEYWIQGLRNTTGLISWFKRVIKDNSMKQTEAWEYCKEIFNISEEDFVIRPRCHGKPEQPTGTYLIDDETTFDNIII